MSTMIDIQERLIELVAEKTKPCCSSGCGAVNSTKQ